ncbi:hypothetical protein CSC76_07225 [Pseudoxanthomonas mexicana]|uniref:hypothetical protein n=1 Tax=Pseudoxanthomonas mexicana TaxID=128785 RepID=UPI00138A0036|nr:hypothetical protein [Pseudoxanthomonas mexicana]KAF1728120.1 hypothetical protein CSC76_07225 [Pseudoxanthomonas mexicana]
MSYTTAVKEYVERYKAETGIEGPLDTHAVAEWAWRNGLHTPNARTVIDAIAADIAQVFREEYRVDRHGRRYRAKHAATYKQGNKTLSLWADLDDPQAPHNHFVRSFAQRRQQIVGDCLQLKTDVDVYNDKREPTEPIQIPLDFTLDVMELQQPYRKAA